MNQIRILKTLSAALVCIAFTAAILGAGFILRFDIVGGPYRSDKELTSSIFSNILTAAFVIGVISQVLVWLYSRTLPPTDGLIVRKRGLRLPRKLNYVCFAVALTTLATLETVHRHYLGQWPW